jgi:hypothetical protein
LSEAQRREGLDYVESFRTDEERERREREAQQDPLLDAIGNFEADLSSDRIDEIK